MNHKIDLPAGAAASIRLEKLIACPEARPSARRMSARMVKSAALLEPGHFLGWQLLAPRKGLASVVLFGTAALSPEDLAWMGEGVGRAGRTSGAGRAYPLPEELYELYLPAAEAPAGNRIGFESGGGSAGPGTGKWPGGYSRQFPELLRLLRETGAALRVVLGPAKEGEQLNCRRAALRTWSLSGVSPDDYLGRPVRIRVLLRLPGAPSLRLRTALEDAVQGSRLRFLGREEGAEALWSAPLAGAPVLPDYAARTMVLEPELTGPAPGVVLCPEEGMSLPAEHRNPRDRGALVIGRAADAAGARRRITVGETDLRRHYEIVGQTGTGKSTLLSTLLLSAIDRGYGLTLFDPHGSTVDQLLRTLPEKHAARVRVVRLGDAENPVPMNIWDSDDPAREERNINDLCELFGSLFNPPGEVFVGPRYERWLSTFAKASIALLGRRASLESIAVLSQSQDNMLQLYRAIRRRYPELAETIKEEYGRDRGSDFQSTLNWYLCKFQRLTAVEQLRATLGAGANALDFPGTIDTDTVTLIDLASPVIGTHAARIAGTLMLMKLWNAVLGRRERERTHLVAVDEAALFQTNPMPRMLAESRKFGLAMALCHQYTGQLSPEIRDSLEANSANFSAFRLSPRDAASAALRFDDPELKTALTRLDAFRAVTTLSVEGRQTPPFTLETAPPAGRKDGEAVARRIEERSRETLVEPYRDRRALSSREILELLDRKARAAMEEEEEQEIPRGRRRAG